MMKVSQMDSDRRFGTELYREFTNNQIELAWP
jgi:hypothetical protein